MCDKHKRVQLIQGCSFNNSLGEALREINSMNIIKSDFLLVNNNVVTNMDIDQLYSQYKQRRVSNKQMVCMKVFKEQTSFKDYESQ
jgi:translation initiation factor eIF-2B subunit epsilon